MNTVRAMTPECDATIHIFPVSPEARLRLAMRNLEAVLDEQRQSIAGMRDALGVVSRTTIEDDLGEAVRVMERSAQP